MFDSCLCLRFLLHSWAGGYCSADRCTGSQEGPDQVGVVVHLFSPIPAISPEVLALYRKINLEVAFGGLEHQLWSGKTTLTASL